MSVTCECWNCGCSSFGECTAETETLRVRVAELEAILAEIAPEFMLATEARPGADPRYVAILWSRNADNWMLKPKFAAYLKERGAN